ncbi:hypothetical protein WAF17_20835 [Bernardetia sp. ABR2-2B]|uniref:hypothetical protein n=1 Tax=Bernardetia sp. ABR2-2B TaxID=3127472 RepID=UPI0030CD5CEC
MYKIKETEKILEIRSKTAMGFAWTVLFLAILIVSSYSGFEYISIKCERPIGEVTNIATKKGKNKNVKKIFCYINYFSFKEGLRLDSILLADVLRMDKGYSSSLKNESNSTFHYNPTIITTLQKQYPLRRISDVAFTPEVISKKFNEFIIENNTLFVSAWDWYMGWWGVAAGISFLGLLFLSVSGRYQVALFDKEKHTFTIKNYGLLGFVGEEGNWKDIRKIIFQDKKTVHKKGIFFLVRRKTSPSAKKFKTKKIYFTHHTDKTSKEAAQKIADLIRPIARPNSPKNLKVENKEITEQK